MDKTEVEWIYETDRDYTHIGTMSGVTFCGYRTFEEWPARYPSDPRNTEEHNFFQITGFKVDNFQDFWEEVIEESDEMQQSMLQIFGELESGGGQFDMDRILFLAKRDTVFANIVVRGWVEEIYNGLIEEGRMTPFEWMDGKGWTE